MEDNFLYVFDKESKDILIKNGYVMLKGYPEKNLYVFLNKENLTFALDDKLGSTKYVSSNILRF